MENQTRCPNCKSYNVKVWTKSYKLLLGLILAVFGGTLCFIGSNSLVSSTQVLTWLSGAPLTLVGICYIIMGFGHDYDKGQCKNCKLKFDAR